MSINIEEYKKLITQEQPKKNKYGNKEIIIDGITFQSKKEGRYYSNLKLLQKAGEVVKFDMQVPFTLFEGFKLNGKSVFRPIKYILDFVVSYKNGQAKYVDTKGCVTPLSQIKRKWMMDKFGIFVEFV
jgi:hypothetical protein